METSMTKFGSKRYSFKVCKREVEEVVRVFERDNKLSIHLISRHPWDNEQNKLKSRVQVVLAVKDNKLYMYHTSGKTMIRAITVDRLSGLFNTIHKILLSQGGENKTVGMGSIGALKKIIADFLYSRIEWYPKISTRKLKTIDIVLIGCSKIIADRYIHEGKISYPIGAVQSIIRHSDTLSQMSNKIFGFSSAWANTECVNILDGKFPLGIIFKGILPVDKIKGICNQATSSSSMDSVFGMYGVMQRADIRRFIKMFHADTVYKWYTKSTNDRFYKNDAEAYLGDTVRMWNIIPEEYRELPSTNNLKRIHDLISMTHRKMSQKDYNLKISNKALKVDDMVVNGRKLVVPKTNYQLIE